jgi:hypothetical protein
MGFDAVLMLVTKIGDQLITFGDGQVRPLGLEATEHDQQRSGLPKLAETDVHLVDEVAARLGRTGLGVVGGGGGGGSGQLFEDWRGRDVRGDLAQVRAHIRREGDQALLEALGRLGRGGPGAGIHPGNVTDSPPSNIDTNVAKSVRFLRRRSADCGLTSMGV